MITLHHGDCLAVLKTLADASVDAVVTDPPAGIGFMGKKWDTPGAMVERPANTSCKWDQVGGNHHPTCQDDVARTRRSEGRKFIAFMTEALAECLRVAKPGSVLLCWAIPRTSHWTGTAIEDAGWIIENRIAHVFGSGFPKHKSHLKPAVEDWWLARKPGPKWLGVEACRVGTSKPGWKLTPGRLAQTGMEGYGHREGRTGAKESDSRCDPNTGRWPANLCLSHSAMCGPDGCHGSCPVRLMGEQGGESKGDSPNRKPRIKAAQQFGWSGDAGQDWQTEGFTDSGSPARFFPNFDADPFLYCPKASRKDRNAGCEGMEEKAVDRYGEMLTQGPLPQQTPRVTRREGNNHPTVKPTALMQWLCRLACPPGGTILDPFLGSGSTGRGAVLEGFGFVGIEREEEYLRIAEARIAEARAGLPLFGGAAV